MRVARVIRNTETGQVATLHLTGQNFNTFEAFSRYVAMRPEAYAGESWTLVAMRPVLSVQPYDGYNIEVIEPVEVDWSDQPAEGGDQ